MSAAILDLRPRLPERLPHPLSAMWSFRDYVAAIRRANAELGYGHAQGSLCHRLAYEAAHRARQQWLAAAKAVRP